MATPKKKPTEKFVKDIRQNTRRIFTAEQKDFNRDRRSSSGDFRSRTLQKPQHCTVAVLCLEQGVYGSRKEALKWRCRSRSYE